MYLATVAAEQTVALERIATALEVLAKVQVRAAEERGDIPAAEAETLLDYLPLEPGKGITQGLGEDATVTPESILAGIERGTKGLR